MSTPTTDELRETLRKLEPTGRHGFEGLMAAVLTDLTKRSFALANSGAQFGKDGQSVLDNGAIAFEGKLYNDKVEKDQVLSKIAEISVNEEGQTELWILASTGPISTQHITTAQKVGRKLGLTVKVLAWPDTGLSEFATLIAMTPAVSAKFLSDHTGTPNAEVLAQLHAVRADPQFSARSAELLTDLQQPSLAPAYALKDNTAWLSKAFSNRKRARAVFGQEFSPDDDTIPTVMDRPALRAKLATSMFSKPDGSITAVLGGEGNGKSWIFAQAWMRQTAKPLTIVILPDDFKVPLSVESLQDLLIAKLLTQTGDIPTRDSTSRWQNHFKRWRQGEDPEKPRLIVYVDGLNQRENLDWARLIDTLSELIAEVGGNLVISARRVFYRDNLQGRLVTKVVECDVPEWSNAELDSLLVPLGTSTKKLNPNVVRSLRNPRLFGVAAELLKGHAIEQLEELSVNRLLFEHIRTGATTDGSSVTPKQFVSDIRTHADQIIARLKENKADDLTIFNRPGPFTSGQTVAEQFVLTSAGRFFETLEDDPSKYVLRDQGLSLALGLSLVNTARTAFRQGKDVEDALSNVLDPIAALDRTSDVLIGAVLAAVLEQSPSPVTTALVRCFIALQNIDGSFYAEFQALLKRNPTPFIDALEQAARTGNVTSNLSWLLQAVHDTRASPECSVVLNKAIHRWLCMYSTSPERMMNIAPDAPEEERKKHRANRETEIAETIQLFSDVERRLLTTMNQEERGDYSHLSHLAFEFLAGQPLAEYAESLRNWAFAAALNGGFYDHRDEFNQLIRFNLVDWKTSRLAILEAAKIFRAWDTSRIGRSTLVYLLYATGDSLDAAEAEQIIEDLDLAKQRLEGWRLVENYCETDPCDPSSQRPENIDVTAEKYRAIEVSTLKEHRGQGKSDRFFDMARPGLARFKPDAALDTLRRFANQSLSRQAADFGSAASFIEQHTVALDDSVAPSFVKKAAEIATEALEGDKNKQKYIAAQYALLIAFPHMSGDAQFDALIAHPNDSTFLRDLGALFQPSDPFRLEAALKKADAEKNEVVQFRILAFAELSGTPLTPSTKALVVNCLSASQKRIRLSALGLIRATADTDLLAALVESKWSAKNLGSASDNVEMLHGSEALVLAAEKGLLPIESCLERIDLLAYQNLVIRLGPKAALAVAARLDDTIRKAAVFKVQANLPDIEQSFEGRHWPSVLEVSEKPVVGDETTAESDHRSNADAWYQRQERNQDVVNRFERELANAGAQIIIRSVRAKLIAEIDKASPTITDGWLDFFLGLDQDALNNVHNVASALVEAISHRDPAGGLALIKRLSGGSPHVRVTLGRDHLSLEAVTAWAAASTPEMMTLRAQRLDRSTNDHELAMEILAAIRAEREAELREYVLDRRNREEPAHRARAAMVAGLCPAEEWALETIELFKNTHGFLRGAYEGARSAMDRHLWSRHWSHQLGESTDPIDVWRYSVLLYKIVDGRVRSSDIRSTNPNPIIDRFESTFDSGIRNRIRRWKNERSSKLFGMTVPDKIFLPC